MQDKIKNVTKSSLKEHAIRKHHTVLRRVQYIMFNPLVVLAPHLLSPCLDHLYLLL